MNDALQKLLIGDPKKTTKPMQSYIEYDYMQENEFLFTLEYYSYCEKHFTIHISQRLIKTSLLIYTNVFN